MTKNPKYKSFETIMKYGVVLFFLLSNAFIFGQIKTNSSKKTAATKKAKSQFNATDNDEE